MDKFYPFVGTSDDYNTADETLPTPYEMGFNFDDEQNTSEVVSGLEAIKIWCYLAIKTQRYATQIFTSNYGSEHEQLIGFEYTKELTESEAYRYIRECLMVNPYISDVKDKGVHREGDTIKINVEIVTNYGTLDMEV